MRKFKRRLSALIIAVVIAITSFVQPVFAVAVVDDAAMAYIIYALAGGAGIYTLGTNEEIQKAYKQYMEQSDLKDYYSGLVAGGTLELYEVGSRIGVKLGSEVIDRLGDIYTDLYNYFSADKDSVIAPDGAVYDYTAKYVEFEKTYVYPTSGTLLRILWSDGCWSTCDVTSFDSAKGKLNYCESGVNDLSGNCFRKDYNPSSPPTETFGVSYNSYGKYYGFDVTSGLAWINEGCQHYKYKTDLRNVNSVIFFNDTYIFNNAGYADIPAVPLTHDTPIPADVWRGGFEDGLQNADEHPMIWFPTGGKVYDNYNDVYDPDTGLIGNVDIPGYVDRDTGWVAGDTPDINNPDITVPDVDVPDMPDVGDSTDVTNQLGAIGGILSGLVGLVQGLYGALANLADLIAEKVIGQGKLNFDTFKGIGLSGLFPFCIPFDLVNCIRYFDVSPVVPSWTVDFSDSALAPFGSFTIDFSAFTVWANIFKFFLYSIFIAGIIKLTRHLIKG